MAALNIKNIKKHGIKDLYRMVRRNDMDLVFGLVWAVVGAIATRLYGEMCEDDGAKRFNPLTIYIGICYMLAGIELMKFVG